VDFRERTPQCMTGTGGFDDAVANTHQRQQRVLVVGDRRGVVCQRHHLALVFELAHVEEVGDVLEEDAERAPRRRYRHPLEPPLAKRRNRRGEAIAQAVDCQHGARTKA
jgi:hypothetical protein